MDIMQRESRREFSFPTLRRVILILLSFRPRSVPAPAWNFFHSRRRVQWNGRGSRLERLQNGRSGVSETTLVPSQQAHARLTTTVFSQIRSRYRRRICRIHLRPRGNVHAQAGPRLVGTSCRRSGELAHGVAGALPHRRDEARKQSPHPCRRFGSRIGCDPARKDL